MHEVSIRELAVGLRRQGYAYPYISTKTGISKSTLSGWLADVKYTPNSETIASFGKARARASEKRTLLRQEAMRNIRAEASTELGAISTRDLLMFGLGLYMGEGSKTNGIVNVANADPQVMKSVVAWFKILGVTNEQFSARIFLYPDNNLEKSLHFWSRTTSIPKAQFHKPYIDRRGDKKLKKQGKLPFGTLHVRVRSGGRKEFGVHFSRRIQALNEILLEKIVKLRD